MDLDGIGKWAPIRHRYIYVHSILIQLILIKIRGAFEASLSKRLIRRHLYVWFERTPVARVPANAPLTKSPPDLLLYGHNRFFLR